MEKCVASGDLYLHTREMRFVPQNPRQNITREILTAMVRKQNDFLFNFIRITVVSKSQIHSNTWEKGTLPGDVWKAQIVNATNDQCKPIFHSVDSGPNAWVHAFSKENETYIDAMSNDETTYDKRTSYTKMTNTYAEVLAGLIPVEIEF